ncbi:hypothetical protein ACS0TY_009756 [Phlomoides rotata]
MEKRKIHRKTKLVFKFQRIEESYVRFIKLASLELRSNKELVDAKKRVTPIKSH